MAIRALFLIGAMFLGSNKGFSMSNEAGDHQEGQKQMDYVSKQEKKKWVIGIPIKTSNENGQFFIDVPPLWERFYKEGMAEKIPNRLNKDLLAVYTDYEGDYTKPFTYIIGCEVSSLDKVPEGMRGIEIPAFSYAVFTAKGEFPQSMGIAWHAIWHSGLKRSYTTDYEIYHADFNPQNNPEIDIFIAVEK
jgi:predicted transcriptional regulator YdeE